MRILTVANHLGARGGLERTQLTNCRALAARGHRLDLVYVSAGDFAPEWEAFARTMVRSTGTLPRRRRPLASVAGVAATLRAGRRLRPDVLYVYRYWDLPYAVMVGALAGAPVVFHLCLPPPVTVPRWLRPFLERVSRTLSVSRDTATRWAGTGLRAQATSVVLTGIDLHRYVPAPPGSGSAIRRTLGIADDAFLVLYAGRIGREKGVDVLVRAAVALGERAPGAHLLVVGSPSLGADPADSARYEAELRQLAGDGVVTFLPAQRDVLGIIQAADVAVAPSLWPEPLSRSVMEPLACGVPVVATRVGGNPEILTEWLSRYLVEPHDVPGLVDALVSLYRWRQSEPDLGQRCRRHAEERLSLDTEVDAIEAALDGAIGDYRSRPRRWRTSSATDVASCG